MNFSFLFCLNSVLLGVGLAMDAFSVSIVNALREPKMLLRRMILIAGVYAVFQFAMPIIGWLFVNLLLSFFERLRFFLPFVSFVLLLFIGIKMIAESVKENFVTDDESFMAQKSTADDEKFAMQKERISPQKEIGSVQLSFVILLLQGIATSIDALSVGVAIGEYSFPLAFCASVIIAAVTFFICFCGLLLGKKIGEKLGARAEIFGGIILIAIGIEILVKSFL